ncbi:EexN family lipoprotein [Bartonella sp. WD16.2]|uniref:EexN family lipoprotein n=1 Tax=Bartonella sp. WD16.2 TaxID=1933904 RepID=UPI000999BB62|nr:EexN family lipoprotein [Bartonella sp. WD16.2]AQX20320.1 hypothetical protein BWD162_012220 [Bartonella sp. WD16.2]
MKKFLLLCTVVLTTGLTVAGCEKTYSVEEFKKNEELLAEWALRCMSGESSKNCDNAWEADKQLNKEGR